MRGALSLLLVLAALFSGCRTARAPILGSGPLGTVDGTLFEDVIFAAESAGYRPIELEPAAGRFAVVARSDGRGGTRFVVQCFADGWVSITPTGPGIEMLDDGRLEMPTRVRDEYAALAEEVDRSITVSHR